MDIVEEMLVHDSDIDNLIFQTLNDYSGDNFKTNLYTYIFENLNVFNNTSCFPFQADVAELENTLLNIITDNTNELNAVVDDCIPMLDNAMKEFLKDLFFRMGIVVGNLSDVKLTTLGNILDTTNNFYRLDESMLDVVLDYTNSLEDEPDSFASLLEAFGCSSTVEEIIDSIEDVDDDYKLNIAKYLNEKRTGVVEVDIEDTEFIKVITTFNTEVLNIELSNEYETNLNDYLIYLSRHGLIGSNFEDIIPYANKYLTKFTNGLINYLDRAPYHLAITLICSKFEKDLDVKRVFPRPDASEVARFLVHDQSMFKDEEETSFERVNKLKLTITTLFRLMNYIKLDEELDYGRYNLYI